jgi:transposase
MMSKIIGIDVSQKSSSFHLMGAGNKEKIDGSFSMNREGFESLLAQTGCTDAPRFVMESTGRYHITLAHFLLQKGLQTFIVNPVLVKQFSKAHTLRKTKTDKVDARTIASFALSGTAAMDNTGRAMDDQKLSIARRREQVAEEVAKAKTQLKADLTVAFPEILSDKVFTMGMLRLLSRFPCASSIQEASDEQLQQALKGERGRGISLTVAQLRELATDSIGLPSYGPLVSDSAESLLFLNCKLDGLTDQLIAIVRQTQGEEMDIITSIQGIGDITAAHFLTEIGSIDRFERYQNLIAFCGTDPGIYQSGAITKRGRITKHGNASLRKYLYLMGMGLIRCNPHFKAFYDKKRDEGFPHRKAMVALMNKLIKTLFAMLKKKEKFIVQS